jgi:D-serine deaminase-like pyridoxal phosphate-dependent protein
MTEEPDNLVLRYLRKIDEKTDRLDERMTDAIAELRSVKTHMSAFLQAEVAQDGSIASILARLEKIERRLELNN